MEKILSFSCLISNKCLPNQYCCIEIVGWEFAYDDVNDLTKRVFNFIHFACARIFFLLQNDKLESKSAEWNGILFFHFKFFCVCVLVFFVFYFFVIFIRSPFVFGSKNGRRYNGTVDNKQWIKTILNIKKFCLDGLTLSIEKKYCTKYTQNERDLRKKIGT